MTGTRALPRTAPKKTVREAYPTAVTVAENVRILMDRHHDTQEELAAFLGITDRTLRDRLARPWEFRFSELEDLARYYNVPVRDLTRPVRFADD